MRVYKIKRAEFKNIGSMLKRIGATIDNQAYPQFTYVSKKTYSKMQRIIGLEFKKEYPGISDRKLELAVGMHLLNWGPVECEGILTDMILVDNFAVERKNAKPGV